MIATGQAHASDRPQSSGQVLLEALRLRRRLFRQAVKRVLHEYAMAEGQRLPSLIRRPGHPLAQTPNGRVKGCGEPVRLPVLNARRDAILDLGRDGPGRAGPPWRMGRRCGRGRRQNPVDRFRHLADYGGVTYGSPPKQHNPLEPAPPGSTTLPGTLSWTPSHEPIDPWVWNTSIVRSLTGTVPS